jgi:hypothetical protein
MKCFIDTGKILELAKRIYEDGDYDNYHQIQADAKDIIQAIEDPLAGLPKDRVETTISRRTIQYLQTDVLGYEGVAVVTVGGAEPNMWYRLDIPRAFALRLLHELEDEWFHGPNQPTRRMCHSAHKTLKKALGV